LVDAAELSIACIEVRVKAGDQIGSSCINFLGWFLTPQLDLLRGSWLLPVEHGYFD
jgi:hypothetical protein